MEYVTVYETFKKSENHILTNIFKDNGLRYRSLNSRTREVVPIGFEVQVLEEDKERALELMRENGFLGKRLATTDESPSGKFWIYLFIALIIVILVGIAMSMLL